MVILSCNIFNFFRVRYANFLPQMRVVLVFVFVLFRSANSLRNSKQTFSRGKALFFLDIEIPKLSFS